MYNKFLRVGVYYEMLGEFNFNRKKTDMICNSVDEARRNFSTFVKSRLKFNTCL
jgi:hypothetical protein